MLWNHCVCGGALIDSAGLVRLEKICCSSWDVTYEFDEKDYDLQMHHRIEHIVGLMGTHLEDVHHLFFLYNKAQGLYLQ